MYEGNQFLNPTIFERRDVELFDSMKYFRRGTIWYAQTNPYESMFKARPVLVVNSFNTNYDKNGDFILTYSITSNPKVRGSLPILLGNMISFVNPFREYQFPINSFPFGNKADYYGSVDDRILEMLKYIKLKHTFGIYSEEHEKFIYEYEFACLKALDSGKYTLKRTMSTAGISIYREFLCGKFYNTEYVQSRISEKEKTNLESAHSIDEHIDDAEDTKTVYSTSSEGNGSSFAYSPFSNIESMFKFEPEVTQEDVAKEVAIADIPEDDSVEDSDENESVVEEAVEEIEEEKAIESEPEIKKGRKVKKFIPKNGYWSMVSGTRILLPNSSLSIKDKIAFLEDVYKLGNYSEFATKFNTTYTTVRNRINKYMNDVDANPRVNIPNEIRVTLQTNVYNKRKSVTPPPDSLVI